jgi:hypothetical protein
VPFLRQPRPTTASKISIPERRLFGYLALTFQCSGMLNAMCR